MSAEGSVQQTVEVPIAGMDCAECAQHVRQSLATLPGVHSVEVFLASEKARIQCDPAQVDLPAIHQAVERAGYTVPAATGTATSAATEAATVKGSPPLGSYSRSVLVLLGVVFAVVLFVVVVGEWLGLFERLTELVPWPLGVAVVLLAGYPVFRNVLRASLRRQVTSHTLMSVGVLAALLVGQWVTAAVVVFFMRIGDYTERFVTEHGRNALRNLTALAPQTARIERDGVEQNMPLTVLEPGAVVIVRPGEKIPTDGEVMSGNATIDQAAITGESLPVEVGPGASVYAATIATLGSLRVRVTRLGKDSTFGRILQLVEEAESHRGPVQRIADKFSAYYLPVVGTIAALTLLLRHDPLATAAVLVVACSCSFALATPLALLASIGTGARQGLLIKGGKYLEALARADVLLLDKTGTLTLGRPQVTDVLPVGVTGVTGVTSARAIATSEEELLRLAASAERYSEHPLAEAVRTAAREQGVALCEPVGFTAVPGQGVRAQVDGAMVTVGSQRFVADVLDDGAPNDAIRAAASRFQAQGKATLFVARDGVLVGMLAAADTLRPEVPAALAAARTEGIRQIELLTGDNERAAATLAETLGIAYRANMLPEDKIAAVKEYQARGHVVAMVGDGVNDAPALAQADIGIAMGAAGSDVAIETAHIALLRDDWMLVPAALHLAHRAMRVIKGNIAFTAVYNMAGLALAALGFLPPMLAAAAQSLPDVGILGNSSRLLASRSNAPQGTLSPQLQPQPQPQPQAQTQPAGCDELCESCESSESSESSRSSESSESGMP